MKTQDYRTKTIFRECDNGVVGNFYPISFDMGYGGVKLYGPNICAEFPSYARVINPESYMGELSNDDIWYKDLTTGSTWLVGRTAQNTIQTSDTNDTIEALCGRNRYFTPMFKVLIETAIGLCVMNTVHGKHTFDKNSVPFVQTGLPCQYIDSDSEFLKEVISKHHEFSLRIGSGKIYTFNIDIPTENILIMRQPMGAFISASTDANWNQDVSKFANSNVLIFDPGFKTLDTFSIRGGILDSKESWSELGMSRILIETSKEIMKKYGTEIPPANMQRILESGLFTRINRRERKTDQLGFTSILEEKSKLICNIALDKAFDMYDSLADYRYLIVSGGTGAAWSDWIVDSLKNMNTLKVITGPTPDGMPQNFSNVRGYHSFLLAYLNKLVNASL